MKNEYSFSNEKRETARAVALALGLVAVLSVLLVAFSWPSANIAPRDLPIVVAGPPQATAAVERALQQARPGAFDVTAMADEQAARAAIRDRDAYGAVVLAPDGPPTVLTASAASPAVAQLLGQLATSLPTRPPHLPVPGWSTWWPPPPATRAAPGSPPQRCRSRSGAWRRARRWCCSSRGSGTG